jgi:uncharacterized membrane protein
MNLHGPVHYLTRVAFFTKLLYMFSALYVYYLISEKKEDTEVYEHVEFWKERFEFIFMICMSILILYYFSPLTGNTLKFDNETKFLFFVFGVILLIDVKWKLFFEQSLWFTMLQKTV